MSIQVKAFQFSLLIHGALFAGLVLAGLLPTKQPPPVVIDFSLNLTEARAGEPAPAAGSEVPSPAGSASPQPQAVKALPIPPQPKEIPPSPKKPVPHKAKVPQNRPAPSPHIVKEVATTEPAQSRPEPAAAVTESASSATGQPSSASSPGAGLAQGKDGGGSANGSSGGRQGEGGMRYDFAYVRERILKNLHFPASARQRGQTGKIVVSFNLMADGQVERIAIVTGSGHDILDQAVIDTIRRVAPFPRPPVSAQLVLPIVFHLK
jgi:protein TonB